MGAIADKVIDFLFQGENVQSRIPQTRNQCNTSLGFPESHSMRLASCFGDLLQGHIVLLGIAFGQMLQPEKGIEVQV